MLKIYISILVIIFFTACSSISYNYEAKSKELALNMSDKIKQSVTLSNPTFKYRYSSCTNDAYTIEDENLLYGKLFIEYINLKAECEWNSLARNTFTYELKNQLKLKSLKLVNMIDYENFEFSTYLVNDEEYLDLIYIYTISETTFILDYKGFLSSTIIKKFDPHYTSKYLIKKRFLKHYAYSLTRFNFFNNYFDEEVFDINSMFYSDY